MSIKGKLSEEKIFIGFHTTFHVDDGQLKTQIETHSHDVIKLSLRLGELSQNNIFKCYPSFYLPKKNILKISLT